MSSRRKRAAEQPEPEDEDESEDADEGDDEAEDEEDAPAEGLKVGGYTDLGGGAMIGIFPKKLQGLASVLYSLHESIRWGHWVSCMGLGRVAWLHGLRRAAQILKMLLPMPVHERQGQGCLPGTPLRILCQARGHGRALPAPRAL
jgi:hypothetical protein